MYYIHYNKGYMKYLGFGRIVKFNWQPNVLRAQLLYVSISWKLLKKQSSLALLCNKKLQVSFRWELLCCCVRQGQWFQIKYAAFRSQSEFIDLRTLQFLYSNHTDCSNGLLSPYSVSQADSIWARICYRLAMQVNVRVRICPSFPTGIWYFTASCRSGRYQNRQT